MGKHDVDPNQAPGGQNKPRSQGGRAGSVSGDRNTDNHPGYVENAAEPGRKESGNDSRSE